VQFDQFGKRGVPAAGRLKMDAIVADDRVNKGFQ
jgi:hypothetical protein